MPEREISVLKKRISEAITAIRDKQSGLTLTDLRMLLFRAASSLIFFEQVSLEVALGSFGLTRRFQWDYDLAHFIVALPFEAFTQSAISAGIESWSWIISERPAYEVTLMSEIAAAWENSVKFGKGMFSKSQK